LPPTRFNRDTKFLGGSLSERLLELLYFDSVFVGADGVDEEGVRCVRTPEVARLTQVMLKPATRRFLVADHNKAGERAYVKNGALNDFDLGITTPGIPPNLISNYEKMTTIKTIECSEQQD